MENSLGIARQIHLLDDDQKTIDAYKSAIGKRIAAVKLDDDRLHFLFSDGKQIVVFDEAQSCCESRYMTTDDDLGFAVGSHLLSMIVKPGPEEDDGTCHEIEFLEVVTSRGSFTIATHNEHNGYYGGFSLVVRSSFDE